MTAPQMNQGPRPWLGVAIIAAGVVAIMLLVAGSAMVLAGGDGSNNPNTASPQPGQPGAAGSASPSPTPGSPEHQHPTELAGTGRPADIEFRPVLEVIPRAKNCGSGSIWCGAAGGPDAYRLGPAVLSTPDVVSAEARISSYGEYVVGITLSDEGALKFEAVTRGLSQNPSTTKPQLAVVVDNVVIAAPVVQGAVPGGKIDISSHFTQAQAQRLADEINP